MAVYRIPAGEVRDDYRLRGNHRAEIEAEILARFRRMKQAKPGDLLLMIPAADQLHLGIITRHGFIHADARLRRVVETPGLPSWAVAGTYRLRKS